MLTHTRQQHGMPGDHVKWQANMTKHLLRPQQSSKLGELVAVHAQGSWKTVKITGEGLEDDNKVKWGYNYARVGVMEDS